jgi:hypothetical protein
MPSYLPTTTVLLPLLTAVGTVPPSKQVTQIVRTQHSLELIPARTKIIAACLEMGSLIEQIETHSAQTLFEEYNRPDLLARLLSGEFSDDSAAKMEFLIQTFDLGFKRKLNLALTKDQEVESLYAQNIQAKFKATQLKAARVVINRTSDREARKMMLVQTYQEACQQIKNL